MKPGKETAETYAHHVFYVIAEAAFIVLILWHAWKWPTQEASADHIVSETTQRTSSDNL